jgi:hypothetical protein
MIDKNVLDSGRQVLQRMCSNLMRDRFANLDIAYAGRLARYMISEERSRKGESVLAWEAEGLDARV